MSSHQNMRKMVEQLKLEAEVKPMLVSQAAQSLKDYCEKHHSSDMLLTGMSPIGENPYKDKAKCLLL